MTLVWIAIGLVALIVIVLAIVGAAFLLEVYFGDGFLPALAVVAIGTVALVLHVPAEAAPIKLAIAPEIAVTVLPAEELPCGVLDPVTVNINGLDVLVTRATLYPDQRRAEIVPWFGYRIFCDGFGWY